MNEYKLLNFYFGPEPSSMKFDIGPFSINLQNSYFDYPQVANREDTITAIVKFDGSQKSMLCKAQHCTVSNCIWDLIYIFSFLLGRAIVPACESFYFVTKYSGENKIVDDINTLEAANIAWTNRNVFKSDIEKKPLWNYFQIIQSSFIENKIIFSVISLEIIQSLVLKKIELNNGQDIEYEKLCNVKSELVQIINKSELISSKKESLVNTINSWVGKSSVEGLKRYLFEYEYINNLNVSGELYKRIQFIDRLRNSILHRIEIKYPNWIDDRFSQVTQMLNYSLVLMPTLIQNYLCRYFKILHFPRVKKLKEEIRYFFDTGKWPNINYSDLPK